MRMYIKTIQIKAPRVHKPRHWHNECRQHKDRQNYIKYRVRIVEPLILGMAFHQSIIQLSGCGLLYGAACTRRTGRQQVEVGSTIFKKLKGGVKCLHFFCRSDPKYKLPVATLQRLSYPASQTGPSAVVGPTVPAHQKSLFFALNETLLAKSTSHKPL